MMKGDGPEIDTMQTQRFDRHLALPEKIQETFTDIIPNKVGGRVAVAASNPAQAGP